MEWFCEECTEVVRRLNETESPYLDPIENENLRAFLEDPNAIERFTPG